MERAAAGAEGNGDPLTGTGYRSIDVIGRGGVGEVHLAEHLELKKRVAVKVLRPQFHASERQMERLRREARALGALRHPNIVAVSDAGVTPSGQFFLVMERLVGCTLHTEMHIRRLPVSEALSTAIAVLSGLGEAHRAGFVHRDIKPGNIFLHTDGSERIPKILDFGVAKFLAPSAFARVPLTSQGQAVGTPLHMSPEQASGRPVDGRADLYAVGLLLYEMITGRGPFATRDPDQAMAAHVNETPAAPSSLAAEPVAAELDAIVLKALAKDPADRFQTAEEMADALAGVRRAIRQPVGWLATLGYDSSDPAAVKAAPRARAESPLPEPAAEPPPDNPTLQSAGAPGPLPADVSTTVRDDATPPAMPVGQAATVEHPAPPPARTLGVFALVLLVSAIVAAALMAWLFAGGSP